MNNKHITNLVMSGIATGMYFYIGSYGFAVFFAVLFGISLGDLVIKAGWMK